MFKKIWGRHDYLTREKWNTNSHVEKKLHNFEMP